MWADQNGKGGGRLGRWPGEASGALEPLERKLPHSDAHRSELSMHVLHRRREAYLQKGIQAKPGLVDPHLRSPIHIELKKA